MAVEYSRYTIELTRRLDDRTGDMLRRRFGLHGKGRETLESIGEEYGVTRERVRQIVEHGLSRLKGEAKEHGVLRGVFAGFDKKIRDSQNICREDALLDSLTGGGRGEADHAFFLLHLANPFWRHPETAQVHAFWTTDRNAAVLALETISRIISHIETLVGEPVAVNDLAASFKTSPRSIMPCLEVSKGLSQNPEGKWGPVSWPEINPRGVKDKAYLVFKRQEAPMHFTLVAQNIDRLAEFFAPRKKKKTLAQTVHNELIKDPRFVLVGRGTYALAEWGYKPGTVKDVLAGILKEHRRLSKEELVAKTLEQRQVKESTILMNLQDRSVFARQGDGTYNLA